MLYPLALWAELYKSASKDATFTFSVSFPPGVIEGDAISYLYQGNESKNEKGTNGSFIAIPIYNIDKSKYRIEGPNIYETVYVDYAKCLLGTDINLKVPGREEIRYHLNEGTKPGMTYTSYGAGLKFHNDFGQEISGNYIFNIQYKVPDKLSSEEKQLLQSIIDLKEKRGEWTSLF